MKVNGFQDRRIRPLCQLSEAKPRAHAALRMSITNPPKLISARLGAYKNIRHGFYGRAAGDARAAATCAHIINDLGGGKLFVNQQNHGVSVRVIKTAAADEKRRADGLVTAVPGIALGVLSADCAPVLLADGEAAVIGAAHAGWRGALAGITDAVIARMLDLGARRTRIIAAIGPAIQFNSYRVGAEFSYEFQRRSAIPCAECFRAADGVNYFDLPKYARLRLRAAGVTAADILAVDTFVDAGYFSHRRDACGGRQLSAIVLR